MAYGTNINNGRKIFMKKVTISLILVIFLMNMFYPVIYAVEEILVDEEKEQTENSENYLETSELFKENEEFNEKEVVKEFEKKMKNWKN